MILAYKITYYLPHKKYLTAKKVQTKNAHTGNDTKATDTTVA
jgi:hypothetical protein